MKLSSFAPVLVVLCLLACIPVRSCTFPDYKVLARDSDGHPLSGISLFEIYQYNGLVDGEETATAKTDAHGTAEFARRYEWRSVVSLTLGCVYHFVQGGCGATHDISGQVANAREFARDDRKTSWTGNRRSLVLTYKFCHPGDPWPCAGTEFSEPEAP